MRYSVIVKGKIAMEMDKILSELKRFKLKEALSNKMMAQKLGCSESYLSEVLKGKKRAGGDLILSLQRLIGPITEGDKPVVVNGDRAHIDIHHTPTTVAEAPETYLVCSLMSGWDDKKRKKLARLALELDETDTI